MWSEAEKEKRAAVEAAVNAQQGRVSGLMSDVAMMEQGLLREPAVVVVREVTNGYIVSIDGPRLRSGNRDTVCRTPGEITDAVLAALGFGSSASPVTLQPLINHSYQK